MCGASRAGLTGGPWPAGAPRETVGRFPPRGQALPVRARRGVKEGQERESPRGLSPQSAARAASEEAERAAGAAPALSQSYRLRGPLSLPSGGSVCVLLPTLEVKWRSLLAWTEMTKALPPHTLERAVQLHCHCEGCKEVI